MGPFKPKALTVVVRIAAAPELVRVPETVRKEPDHRLFEIAEPRSSQVAAV
jgi:hypothetical protein